MTDLTDLVVRLRANAALMYEAAYEIECLKRTLAELSTTVRQKIADKPSIDEEILDRPVALINFGRLVTPRIHAALSNRTVRDLVRMTERELMLEPNVGRFSIARVRATLAEHGLYLGMNI